MNAPRRPSRERGIVLIWVAILITIFIGFVGLALDSWFAVLTAQQLQVGADAAAMAGARFANSDPDAARSEAIAIAAMNRAGGEPIDLADNPNNDSDGDVVVGYFDQSDGTFTATEAGANAVLVRARRDEGSVGGPLGLLFGPMFGVEEANVAKFAIAVSSESASPGLVVLDTNDPCALDMDSNARITVIGTAHINSSHLNAACLNSNANLTADTINVVGGVNVQGNAQIVGNLNTGSNVIVDPLLDLPVPTYNPAINLGSVNLSGSTVAVRGPGYYSGGIRLDSNAHLTLLPGIYILNGYGLRMNSNSRLTGNGVMLYIIDTTPTNGTLSQLYLDSNTVLNVSPPDPAIHTFAGADTYEDISVFQARENTNDAIMNSNTVVLPGTLYFHAARLNMDSNATIVQSRIIANTIQMDSNVVLNINGDFGGGSTGEVYLAR